jgi:DNA-binding winged helix-turn-helix (wHTH) protein/tetratricopeptide (TPR) repeat protein
MEFGMKGDFTLDQSIVCVSLRTISRAGVSVRIEPRAMRVLEVLAQEAGKVVSKTSLIQSVWGHTYVTDDVLTRCVSCLRKALDDGAREQRVIQTIPKAGYRLIGAIQWIEADPVPASTKSPRAVHRSAMPALHLNPVQISPEHAHPPRSNSWPVRHATPLIRCIGAIAIAALALIAETRLFTADIPLQSFSTLTAAVTRTSAVVDNRARVSAHPQISERLSFNPSNDPIEPGNSRPAVSEAHHDYVLGRYYWNKRTPAGLDRAATLFQQAVNMEPDYARAWAALADTYNVMPDWGVLPPREAFPRAKAAALKALQLDPSLAEAHAALGYAIGNYDWDWPQAEKEFQTALRLDPDYPSGHQWYAMQLASLGRFSEATAEIRKAQQLDPVSPVIGTDAADILYAAGLNAAAIDKFREVIDLNADFPEAHAGLARVYERLGRYDDAVDELGKAADLAGDRTFSTALARAYSRSGYAGTLRELIRHQLRDRASEHYGSAAEIARLYSALGQKRAALDWLEKARDDHDSLVVFLTTTSDFDPVRRDNRFAQLLSATGRTVSLQ